MKSGCPKECTSLVWRVERIEVGLARAGSSESKRRAMKVTGVDKCEEVLG